MEENLQPKGSEEFTEDENFVSKKEILALLGETSANTRRGSKSALLFKKEVEKIESINDKKGKALLHVVNYEGGGFVVMTADKRAQPILAYSEKNTFPLTGKYPSGLMDWLTYSESYVQLIRTSNKKITVSQSQQWYACPLVSRVAPGDEDCDGDGEPDSGGGGSGGPITGGCVEEYYEKGPLLQTEWGQGRGYNNMTPVGVSFGSVPSACDNPYNNGRTLTGCVAVAMAQVMRYHQYPANYNWSIMPNSIEYDFVTHSYNYDTPGMNEVARLMRNVGNKVGMNYGCKASGIKHSDADDEIPQTFKSDFGYSSATHLEYEGTTRYDKVKAELMAGRPVIFTGGEKKGWGINWYADGHCWVADGVRRIFMCPEGGYGTGYLWFHMNWGWHGAYDDWYAFNNFNPPGDSYNYKSGVILNIKP